MDASALASRPDADLLEDWRAGNSQAGQLLFERHYPTVERFLLNKIPADRVVDLVQNTFMACVQARDNIRDPDRFRAYLLRVAYSQFCHHLRKRYLNGASLDPEEVSLRDLDPSASSLVARAREQRLLLEGLRAISINYQTVLELHYWEDLSTIEIAEVLGVPSGTVRSRLQRARDALEAAMAAIANSRELLESTLTDLERWADEVRARLGADAS